jgi:hypothetical protein
VANTTAAAPSLILADVVVGAAVPTGGSTGREDATELDACPSLSLSSTAADFFEPLLPLVADDTDNEFLRARLPFLDDSLAIEVEVEVEGEGEGEGEDTTVEGAAFARASSNDSDDNDDDDALASLPLLLLLLLLGDGDDDDGDPLLCGDFDSLLESLLRRDDDLDDLGLPAAASNNFFSSAASFNFARRSYVHCWYH